MAEVLSQKQIDELLGNIQTGDIDDKQSSGAVIAKKYKEYDFRTPKRITREQIKLLDSIFENFARLFALQLSSMLRTTCEAEIIQLEEQQYYEFSNALNDSVLMGEFQLNQESSQDGHQLLLEMSRPLSYCILDRLLGGNGEGYNIDKDYTDIELEIMRYLFEKSSPIFTSAWSNYVDVIASYKNIETNSRLIQSIAPDETVIIIIIEVTVKNLKEKINICLPSDTLNVIFKSFDLKFTRVSRKMDSETEEQRREFIMEGVNEAPLTITGMLGETEIRLRDLLNLQVGDIIPLNTQSYGDSIQVMVDDVPWFTGSIGVKKKKYAVKVGTVIEN